MRKTVNTVISMCKPLDNTCNTCYKKASDIKDINVDDEIIKTYIYCDIDIKSNKPVKKTLTIPDWVNKIGIDNNINFSQTLTDAIIQQCKFTSHI